LSKPAKILISQAL